MADYNCTGLCINIGSYRKWFQKRYLDLPLPLQTFYNYFQKVTPLCVAVKYKSLCLIWSECWHKKTKGLISHLPESTE